MSYNISNENLNNPLLKDLLKELNSFFSKINVDFYVIGATARDIILSNLHDCNYSGHLPHPTITN
ncbi:hypothetical protein FACS189426_20180 [Bacteroidia bacterium]|nr:hypothetical protein FACS189426_20180 [Bacteroidia bacterium]GHT84953.1 hypothetical protein FACS18947_3100 [Bacteroidia bacterium]GHV70210.1 hypothetical protein FACS189420_0360 [Bacteroidia bacterium]